MQYNPTRSGVERHRRGGLTWLLISHFFCGGRIPAISSRWAELFLFVVGNKRRKKVEATWQTEPSCETFHIFILTVPVFRPCVQKIYLHPLSPPYTQ